MNHKNLSQLIPLIDGPNRSACLALLHDHADKFTQSPGSLTKHQAWKGGYVDHIEETMNFGLDLFELMNSKRKLDFSISDMILVLFLHDLEKPFRYVEPKTDFTSDTEKKKFIDGLIKTYHIDLTEDHINALHYIHGEGDEYSRTERLQKPLAAFVHICDVASARIWFDFPKKS